MPRASAFRTTGQVIVVSPNRMVQVELPNGHRLWARRRTRTAEPQSALAAGQVVGLEMSVCDFSKGFIVDH